MLTRDPKDINSKHFYLNSTRICYNHLTTLSAGSSNSNGMWSTGHPWVLKAWYTYMQSIKGKMNVDMEGIRMLPLVNNLHGTKLEASNWHSKVAPWLASMVTVMVDPNALATAVIINWEETDNETVTSLVWPSCVVPLTITVWSPTGTELYTKPSEPVTVGMKLQMRWKYVILVTYMIQMLDCQVDIGR